MTGRDTLLGQRRMHLGLRFLHGESTGSYVTRLAARNLRPVEAVLASLGNGPMPVDPQYTEMYVSRYARERLANLAGRTVAEMLKRLVSLSDEFLMPADAAEDWEWPWDARAGYVVQACSLCAAQRGTRSTAWLILADPWHVCLRHHRWTDNSRSTQHPYIDLGALRGVVQAQQRLNRVTKRLGPLAARWVQADAYSLLAHSGIPDRAESPDRAEKAKQWRALAVELGEQRVRPLAQFGWLARLTEDLAWLEVRRLSGVLSETEHKQWLPRVRRRYGHGLAWPLATWHGQHRPLARDYLTMVRGGYPVSTGVRNEIRKATGHHPASPLTSLEDATCLPWVRLPGSMERLFL
jgi:hypothetical protein